MRYIFTVDGLEIGEIHCELLTFKAVLEVKRDFIRKTGINIEIIPKTA